MHERSDTLEVSVWSVAAGVGTVLLMGLAGLALFVVGTVLVYVGVVTQPGPNSRCSCVPAASPCGAHRDREEDEILRSKWAQDRCRLRVRRSRRVYPVLPFRRAPDGVCWLGEFLTSATSSSRVKLRHHPTGWSRWLLRIDRRTTGSGLSAG